VTLMSKDLTDIPGKEVLIITVEYPPGGSDPVHRHYANAFVYVLKGSVVMQVKGGKEVTLTTGQTFYEGRDDVHCGPERKHDHAGKNVGHLDQGRRRAPILVPVE
jgi:quercetin dioxygenase-like cupin family protein